MSRNIFIFIFAILLTGSVLAIPSFHQFFGDISYENGTVVDKNVTIVARINNSESGSGIGFNGSYGIDELFFVEDGEDGEIINFYIYGILSGNYSFTNEETTELDLVWSCGNGVLESGEECDLQNITSSCPESGSVSCDFKCDIDYSSCTSSPGSPGRGGLRYSGCVENWICTSWGMCVNEVQTKFCIDENSCGTILNKPADSQACQETVSSVDSSIDSGTGGVGGVFGDESSDLIMWITIILAILSFGLLIAIIIIIVKFLIK